MFVIFQSTRFNCGVSLALVELDGSIRDWRVCDVGEERTASADVIDTPNIWAFMMNWDGVVLRFKGGEGKGG